MAFRRLRPELHTPTLLKLNAPLWTLAVEASFYVVLRRSGGSRCGCAAPAGGPGDRPDAVPAPGVAWNWSIAGETCR